MNGELRIGFFTRRPVGTNEELTFDYQFQTVGKKQQKCYCGSEKCRGYLGASQSSQSTSNLDHIWNTNSDETSDDEEVEEDEANLSDEASDDDHRLVRRRTKPKTLQIKNKTKKPKQVKKDYDVILFQLFLILIFSY